MAAAAEAGDAAGPGPGAGAGAGGAEGVFTLQAEEELRVELGAADRLTVILRDGSAEVFGVELAPAREYVFANGSGFAVFSWYGCVVETRGTARALYQEGATPMVSYVNTHAQLEVRRDAALAEGGDGPRVLVVGPMDSGKSTLANLLLAYAARLERTPVFVELDPGQGRISVPGAVGAVPVDHTALQVERGVTASFEASPLLYYFGHNALGENTAHYKHLVKQLASCVDQRMESDSSARFSGLIANTGGWIDGEGFELLTFIIEAFRIDIALVLGHDRLYRDLEKVGGSGGRALTVVKLPSSGGVVRRDPATRRQARAARIHEYFYGPPRLLASDVPPVFSPMNVDIGFDQVRIYQIGDIVLSQSMLPVGQSAASTPWHISTVDPSDELLHSVLAVCHVTEDKSLAATVAAAAGGESDTGASSEAGAARAAAAVTGDASASTGLTGNFIPDMSDVVASATVAGFVYVVGVNASERTLTVLAPAPELPSRHLLLGSVKWARA